MPWQRLKQNRIQKVWLKKWDDCICIWLAGWHHLCSLLPCRERFLYGLGNHHSHISFLLHFLNMITPVSKTLFYKVYIGIKFSMAFTDPLTSALDIFFELSAFIYSRYCQWTFLLIYLSFDRKNHPKFKSLHAIQKKRWSTPSCFIISPWWRPTKDSLGVIWFKAEFP